MQHHPRVLKYPWHIGHDFELFKLPAKFSLLYDTSRVWAWQHRQLPEQVDLISSLSPEIDDHDMMILHVDQWIFEEEEKLQLFRHWLHRFPNRKVIINHGCNMVDGCSSEQMADLVGDNQVVCNSSTAHELWKLPNSRFIRHGMDASEWKTTDYSLDHILVVQAYGGRRQAYRNNAGVAELEATGLSFDWVGRDRKFSSPDDYRSHLAKSSIFLNPSHASPNPRTRTEAMLSGIAVVTTDSHGESEYIENGVNGFCSNDLNELAEYLRLLQSDKNLTRKIGRAGQETARKLFSTERFAAQWKPLLNPGATETQT